MMKRPILSVSRTRRVRGRSVLLTLRVRNRRHAERDEYYFGYTLIEILVSTALAGLLLAAVIKIFGDVSTSVNESRSMLEAAEQLRLAASRLQQDLAGATATMNPPRKPENNEGYIEIIEGPVGVTTMTSGTVPMPLNPAINSDSNSVQDTTVGDFDDILLFTTRSTGRPFVGKCASLASGTIRSDVAEVAWFVRGRTLYRRVLLVAPAQGPWTLAQAAGFYGNNDISVSVQNRGGANMLVANTLGDLTRRECRFAHPTDVFPCNAARWCWKYLLPTGCTTTVGGYTWLTLPSLPTLRECSSAGWVAGGAVPPVMSAPPTPPPPITLDFWSNILTYRLADNAMCGAFSIADGSRVADDVILNNVIGFDVKVWDPHVVVRETNVGNGAYVDVFPGDNGYALAYSRVGTVVNSRAYALVAPGAYVDLGFAGGFPGVAYSAGNANSFGHLGHNRSSLAAAVNGWRVYDTYSTSHFSANASNGLDDDNNGVVDDDNEKWPVGQDLAPPYPIPLRGIQVKIRVFEPDSRQVREVTVVQDFLPQ
jgi:type II secretory pathway component PulJ